MLKAGAKKKAMQDIQKQLPEETRTKWELTEFEKEGYYGELLEEHTEQALAQGLEQGLRISLLRVLDARGLSPTPEQRVEIDACKDTEKLGRWLDRAIRAESVADVLASGV
jgi:hypothetical protein